jgi:hypothetical protein
VSSARRRARATPTEATESERDPNHSWAESFEHPVFGHVTLRYQGDDLRRIMWTSPDQGQNVHSKHTNPEKFAEILRKLGTFRPGDFGKHSK